jgi:hypothetical protein
MMRTISTKNTNKLRRPMSGWHKNWNTQRTWQFHTNPSETIIQQTNNDGTYRTYRRKRKTQTRTQAFILENIKTTRIHTTTPIIPTVITLTALEITTQYDTQIKPTTDLNCYPSIHDTNTDDTDIAHDGPSQDLHIGIHSAREYERQTFTWITATSTSNIWTRGSVQTTTSQQNNRLRGGLIGLLQALQSIPPLHKYVKKSS